MMDLMVIHHGLGIHAAFPEALLCISLLSACSGRVVDDTGRSQDTHDASFDGREKDASRDAAPDALSASDVSSSTSEAAAFLDASTPDANDGANAYQQAVNRIIDELHTRWAACFNAYRGILDRVGLDYYAGAYHYSA